MMKGWGRLLAAASLLVLVGAGCGASGEEGAKIDAAVSGINSDQAAEQSELKVEEQDAAAVEADKAEVDMYGDATYEIK
jgi:hypothetical protein